MDPRWEDFAAFQADMGERPHGLSLDRIDVSAGYWPANCRWADAEQQANNTTRNRYVEVDGERLSVSQAARRRGFDPDVVFDRLNRLGWTVERALSESKGRQGQRINYAGARSDEPSI